MSSNLSLNYNKSNNNYNSYQTVSVGSNIYVAGGVEYNGENLHTRGLNIYNEGDTVYNITGKILKEAGKNTIQESSSGKSYGLSVSVDTFNSKGQIQNPLKASNSVATVSKSSNKSNTDGVYYTQNEDITKGTSYYNNVGDVVIKGVEVQTGDIQGNSKSLVVETLQDNINSNSRGYSLSYGIGLGQHEVLRNGNREMVNGVHTKSIGVGYNKGMSEERISNAVGSFISERGEFTTNGVRQVGSVIGGGFTLNAKDYTKEDLEDVNRSKTVGINLIFTPGVVEIYRNGLPTGSYKGGTTVGTSITYGEVEQVSKVKTTIDELTKVNTPNASDLSNVNRDMSNRVEVIKDKNISTTTYDLGTEYWLNNYSRESLNTDISKANNKIERVLEILRAVANNDKKDISKYYRDRLDFEEQRDNIERAGKGRIGILDKETVKEIVERAAGREVEDVIIVSSTDPNISEIEKYEQIAGRAYHTGDGIVVLIADNVRDVANALGVLAEEGRHIYHRKENELKDSEDYASFFGRQYERYYDKHYGDNPSLIILDSLNQVKDIENTNLTPIITESLRYTREQLGGDYENDAIKAKITGTITVGGFTPDITGSVSIIRNHEEKKIWVIYDIKGDVKLEKKLAGASLNLGVSYYPGVITIDEFDEPRKRTPLTQVLIDTVLTYGLKTFTGNPYAKASGGIYIGKGGNKTMEIGLTAGIGITAGNENPILPKELTLSVKNELTKVLESTIKEQVRLSKAVKIPSGRIIKEYTPKDLQYRIFNTLPNPSRVWRGLVW